MAALLAVDVGVRTGIALYGGDGRLRWYRSHNLGSANRLKRALPTLIGDGTGVTHATSLRHDAAEAILVGLWGALDLGWLTAIPPGLRR